MGFLGMEEEPDYEDWNFEGGLNYVILQLFILLTVFLQGLKESPIVC